MNSLSHFILKKLGLCKKVEKYHLCHHRERKNNVYFASKMFVAQKGLPSEALLFRAKAGFMKLSLILIAFVISTTSLAYIGLKSTTQATGPAYNLVASKRCETNGSLTVAMRWTPNTPYGAQYLNFKHAGDSNYQEFNMYGNGGYTELTNVDQTPWSHEWRVTTQDPSNPDVWYDSGWQYISSQTCTSTPPPPPPPPPPPVSSLSPQSLQRNIPSGCVDGPYNVTFSWTNSGSGWYLDVSTGDINSDFYNKNISGRNSVNLNEGFTNPFNGQVISSAQPDTNYSWQMWNGASHTPGPSWSVPKCAAPPPPPPPPVTNNSPTINPPTFSNCTNGRVPTTFIWNKATASNGAEPASQYLDLSKSNQDELGWADGTFFGTDVTSGSPYIAQEGNPLGPLDPDADHWWRISNNINGTWVTSSNGRFHTPSCGPTSPPPDPGGLSYNNPNDCTDGPYSVTVSWSPVTGATHYYVNDQDVGNTTQANIPNLLPDKDYAFTVKSANSAGASGGTTATIFVIPKCTIPIPPDGTIVQGYGEPYVYLVDGGRIRWIPDPATLDCLGGSGKIELHLAAQISVWRTNEGPNLPSGYGCSTTTPPPPPPPPPVPEPTPESFEGILPVAGNIDNTSCDNNSGTWTLQFNWSVGHKSIPDIDEVIFPDEQVLDLKLNDGQDFAPGNYVNTIPLSGNAKSYQWPEIAADQPHIWRVAERFGTVWVHSQNQGFNTADFGNCPTSSEPTPPPPPPVTQPPVVIKPILDIVDNSHLTCNTTSGKWDVKFTWSRGVRYLPEDPENPSPPESQFVDLKLGDANFIGNPANGNANYLNAGPLSGDIKEYTWTGLKPNELHSWRVANFFPGDSTAYQSDPASFTTGPCGSTATPIPTPTPVSEPPTCEASKPFTLTSPTNGETLGTPIPDFSWTPSVISDKDGNIVGVPTKYYLDLSDDGFATWWYVAVNPSVTSMPWPNWIGVEHAGGKAAPNDGLRSGKQYQWRVTAMNACPDGNKFTPTNPSNLKYEQAAPQPAGQVYPATNLFAFPRSNGGVGVYNQSTGIVEGTFSWDFDKRNFDLPNVYQIVYLKHDDDNQDPTPANSLPIALEANITGFTTTDPPGLTPNQKHAWTVYTCADESCSTNAKSYVDKFTTIPLPPTETQPSTPPIGEPSLPGSPNLTNPANGTTFNLQTVNNIDFSWEDTKGNATNFWLDVSQDGSFQKWWGCNTTGTSIGWINCDWQTFVPDPAGGANLIDNPDVPIQSLDNATWYWRVSAVNDVGFSPSPSRNGNFIITGKVATPVDTGGGGTATGTGTGAEVPVPQNPQYTLIDRPSNCSNGEYSVNLTWTKNSNVWVDISTDSLFNSDFHNKIVEGDTSTFAPDGFSNNLTLLPNTNYHWRIWYGVENTWINGPDIKADSCTPPDTGATPTNGTGNETANGTASGEPTPVPQNLVIPDFAKPTCTDGTTIGSDGPYSLGLQWEGSGTGWFVDIDNDNNWNNSWLASKEVNGITNTAAPAGFTNGLQLQPDTNYYWRIYYGVPDNWVYAAQPFSVPKCPQPKFPAQLGSVTPQAEQTCTQDNKVILSFNWTPGTGATPDIQWLDVAENDPNFSGGYHAANNPPSANSTFYQIGQTNSQYYIPPLKPSTLYYWRISTHFAGDGFADSDWHTQSSHANFTTRECIATPVDTGTGNETANGTGTGGETIPSPYPVGPQLNVVAVNYDCDTKSYSANLSWTGSGAGWYVDISPNSPFSQSSYWNKPVDNSHQTAAPNGFNSPTGLPQLVLQEGQTYTWRVWDTITHSETGSFLIDPSIKNCPVPKTPATLNDVFAQVCRPNSSIDVTFSWNTPINFPVKEQWIDVSKRDDNFQGQYFSTTNPPNATVGSQSYKTGTISTDSNHNGWQIPQLDSGKAYFWRISTLYEGESNFVPSTTGNFTTDNCIATPIDTGIGNETANGTAGAGGESPSPIPQVEKFPAELVSTTPKDQQVCTDNNLVTLAFSWSRGTGGTIDQQWLDVAENDPNFNAGYHTAHQPPFENSTSYEIASPANNPALAIPPLKINAKYYWRISTHFALDPYDDAHWYTQSSPGSFTTRDCIATPIDTGTGNETANGTAGGEEITGTGVNLVISDFQLSDTKPTANTQIKANFKVKNTGSNAASGYWIRVYPNKPDLAACESNPGGTAFSLASGEEKSFSIPFATPTIPGPATARVFVDALCKHAQSLEELQATATYNVTTLRAPENVFLVNNDCSGPEKTTNIIFSWTKVNGISGYFLDVSSDNWNTFHNRKIEGQDNTSFTWNADPNNLLSDNFLPEPNKPYKFRVTTYNETETYPNHKYATDPFTSPNCVKITATSLPDFQLIPTNPTATILPGEKADFDFNVQYIYFWDKVLTLNPLDGTTSPTDPTIHVGYYFGAAGEKPEDLASNFGPPQNNFKVALQTEASIEPKDYNVDITACDQGQTKCHTATLKLTVKKPGPPQWDLVNDGFVPAANESKVPYEFIAALSINECWPKHQAPAWQNYVATTPDWWTKAENKSFAQAGVQYSVDKNPYCLGTGSQGDGPMQWNPGSSTFAAVVNSQSGRVYTAGDRFQKHAYNLGAAIWATAAEIRYGANETVKLGVTEDWNNEAFVRRVSCQFGRGNVTAGPNCGDYDQLFWNQYKKLIGSVPTSGSISQAIACPSGWPTTGLVTQGPEGAGTPGFISHLSGPYEAIDIAQGTIGSFGQAVYATIPGTVESITGSGSDQRITVKPNNCPGLTSVQYWHLSSVSVKKDDTVDYQTRIGASGNYGSGNHVHYQFNNDRTFKMTTPYIPSNVPRTCNSEAACNAAINNTTSPAGPVPQVQLKPGNWTVVPIYIQPKGAPQASTSGVSSTLAQVQQYYANQLGGLTFKLGSLKTIDLNQAGTSGHDVNWFCQGSQPCNAYTIASRVHEELGNPPSLTKYTVFINVGQTIGLAGGNSAASTGDTAVFTDLALAAVNGQSCGDAQCAAGVWVAHEIGHLFLGPAHDECSNCLMNAAPNSSLTTAVLPQYQKDILKASLSLGATASNSTGGSTGLTQQSNQITTQDVALTTQTVVKPKSLQIFAPPPCSDKPYTLALEWQGQGNWWVDITTDNSIPFANYSNKPIVGNDVANQYTAAPGGFSDNLQLLPDTQYYWRMWYGIENQWAYGPSFNVSRCNPISTVGPQQPSTSQVITPLAPRRSQMNTVTGCPNGISQIAFAWPRVTNADGYYLDISQTDSYNQEGVDFVNLFVPASGIPGATWDTNNLIDGKAPQPATTYSWRVYTYAGDLSDYNGIHTQTPNPQVEAPSCSASGTATATQNEPGQIFTTPAYPIAAPNCALSGPYVLFQWDKSQDADAYYLDVSKTNTYNQLGVDFFNTFVPQSIRPTFTWNNDVRISGMEPVPGEIYYFRVWAYKGDVTNGEHSPLPNSTVKIPTTCTASTSNTLSVITDPNTGTSYTPPVALSTTSLGCDENGKVSVVFKWNPGLVYTNEGLSGFSEQQWLDLKFSDQNDWTDANGNKNYVNQGPTPLAGSEDTFVWTNIEPGRTHRWRVGALYQNVWYHSNESTFLATCDLAVGVQKPGVTTIPLGQFQIPKTAGLTDKICNSNKGSWNLTFNWKAGYILDEATHIPTGPQEEYLDLKLDDGTDWNAVLPGGNPNYVRTKVDATFPGAYSTHTYFWSGIEAQKPHKWRVVNIYQGKEYISEDTSLSLFTTGQCVFDGSVGYLANTQTKEFITLLKKYNSDSLAKIDGDFKGLGALNNLNPILISQAAGKISDLDRDQMVYQILLDGLDNGFDVQGTINNLSQYVTNGLLNDQGKKYLDEKFNLSKTELQAAYNACILSKTVEQVVSGNVGCINPDQSSTQLANLKGLYIQAIEYIGSGNQLLHSLADYDNYTAHFYPPAVAEAGTLWATGQKLESSNEQKAIEIYAYVAKYHDHSKSDYPAKSEAELNHLTSPDHQIRVFATSFVVGSLGFDNFILPFGKLKELLRLPGIGKLVAKEGELAVARSVLKEGIATEADGLIFARNGAKLESGIATDTDKNELARIIGKNGTSAVAKAAVKLSDNSALSFLSRAEDTELWKVYSGTGTRFIVFVDMKGVKQPFYKSAFGTAGKEKSAWHPFFGFLEETCCLQNPGWLVKFGLEPSDYRNNATVFKVVADRLNQELPGAWSEGDIPTALANSVANAKPVEDIGFSSFNSITYNRSIKTPEDVFAQEAYAYGRNLLGRTVSDIPNVKNFDELYSLVDEIGIIEGSGNVLYSSGQLRTHIDETIACNGCQNKLNQITRTGGLRDKVNQLIKNPLDSALDLVKGAKLNFILNTNPKYPTLLTEDKTYIESVLSADASDVWPDLANSLGITASLNNLNYEYIGEGVYKRAFKVTASGSNKTYTFVVKPPRSNTLIEPITEAEFYNYEKLGSASISQIEYTRNPVMRTFHQDPSRKTAVLIEEYIDGPTTKDLLDTNSAAAGAVYKSLGELSGKLWRATDPGLRKTAVLSVPDNHKGNTITRLLNGKYQSIFIDVEEVSNETFSNFIINELLDRTTRGRIPRGNLPNYLQGLTERMLLDESPQETARLLKQSAADFRAMINNETLQRAFQTKFDDPAKAAAWTPWDEGKKTGFTRLANDIDTWVDTNLKTGVSSEIGAAGGAAGAITVGGGLITTTQLSKPTNLSIGQDCTSSGLNTPLPEVAFAWKPVPEADGYYLDISAQDSYTTLDFDYFNVYVPQSTIPGFVWSRANSIYGVSPESSHKWYWRVWAYKGDVNNGVHSAEPNPQVTVNGCSQTIQQSAPASTPPYVTPYTTPPISTASSALSNASSLNQQPNTPPIPQGPNIGAVGQELRFFAINLDYKNTALIYYVDFGDGSTSVTQASSSTTSTQFNHTYFEPGTYQIRIKAANFYDQTISSNWSEPFTTTIHGETINCKDVVYKGDPNKKLDITFLPAHFEQNEMPLFESRVQDVITNGLGHFVPFSDHLSSINVHELPYKNAALDATIYMDTTQTPFIKDIILVRQVGYVCPNDIVLIIVKDAFGGSANFSGVSAVGGLPTTINGQDTFANYAIHELGHAFGQLADEYSITDNAESLGYSVKINCSKDALNPPWKDYPGTSVGIKGCTDKNWYRSTESSLMYTTFQFRPDAFDPWNIKILSDKLKAYE